MRFLLIMWTLLGATVASSTQVAFSSEAMLAGRWELTSIDMPIALRRGDYVVIESATIRIRDACNEVTLRYSIRGNELSATRMTTTAVACDPPDSFEDESRLVYEAVLHSRYQIDGDVLRLFSLSDLPFDYSLEFHRVQ